MATVRMICIKVLTWANTNDVSDPYYATAEFVPGCDKPSVGGPPPIHPVVLAQQVATTLDFQTRVPLIIA